MVLYKTSSPKVSIIIPTYNHGKFISETLENVIAQNFLDWECIVVIDGSTDDTEEICREYAKRDGRIRFMAKCNNGLASARNEGLKQAKGDFVQFLDSDDLLHADKLADQQAAFERTPAPDAVYGNYACFHDGHFEEQWTYSRVELQDDPLLDFVTNWERGLSIPIHCFLYRKSCFDRWGGFDERFTCGKEDWDLHIRFALGGARYHFHSGVGAYYRVTAAGGMARDKLVSQHFKGLLLRKHFLSRRLSPRL
ncbi:MAG TPA: glycosyltransferase, partial [Candidatus Aminicenantes bacterium]|nr:glycosyltransferase [Candidatus Aminicenantes bacterium]